MRERERGGEDDFSQCGTDNLHTIPEALLIFHELAFTVAITFFFLEQGGGRRGWMT